MKDINASVARGELPQGFDFSLKQPDEIDYAKIQYNAFYKTYEYHESKIPNGMKWIPGMDKIIEHQMENSKSPLEQLEEKIKISDR
jgi:hypothetical protein